MLVKVHRTHCRLRISCSLADLLPAASSLYLKFEQLPILLALRTRDVSEFYLVRQFPRLCPDSSKNTPPTTLRTLSLVVAANVSSLLYLCEPILEPGFVCSAIVHLYNVRQSSFERQRQNERKLPQPPFSSLTSASVPSRS